MLPFARIVKYANVLLPPPTIIDVVSGAEHSMFLTSDGEVYVRGLNSRGQCGVGTTATVEKYTRVLPTVKAKAIYTGDYISFIVSDDDTIYTAGLLTSVGATNSTSNSFTVRTGVNTQKSRGVRQIVSCNSVTGVVFNDNSLYTLGYNAIGTGSYVAPANTVSTLRAVASNCVKAANSTDSLWYISTANQLLAVGEMWALNAPLSSGSIYSWATQASSLNPAYAFESKNRAIQYNTTVTYCGGVATYGQLGNGNTADAQGNRVYPPYSYVNKLSVVMNQTQGLTYVSLIVTADNQFWWSGRASNGNNGAASSSSMVGTFMQYTSEQYAPFGESFSASKMKKLVTNPYCTYAIYDGKLMVTGNEYGSVIGGTFRLAQPLFGSN